MECWKNLPVEILYNILQHLEQLVEVSCFPEKYLIVSTKDILQCQLSCVNWSKPARIKIYRNVYIENLKQLEKFSNILIDSNIGVMVEYIIFGFKTYGKPSQIIKSSFSRISYFCTELKGLYVTGNPYNFIWEAIINERQQGRLSKLEEMCCKEDIPYTYLSKYYAAANSLHITLRELVICDFFFTPKELENMLKEFMNLEVINLRTRDNNDIFAIDNIIRKCPSIKSINTDYSEITSPSEPTNSNISCVDTCPNIKEIQIKNLFHTETLYIYIMKAFPNLKKIRLQLEKSINLSPTTTTATTIQLLNHLIKIPDMIVSDIPVNDVEEVLNKLYDEDSVIKNLSISYGIIPGIKNSSIWTVSNNITLDYFGKNCLVLEIYHKNPLPIWPDIGLIEKSGNGLQSLRLNMLIHFWNQEEAINSAVYRNNLSDILRKCPNLKRIHLTKTILSYFGTGLKLQERPATYELISFKDSLIFPSFLSSISSDVSHIKEFTIDNCEFGSSESTSGGIYINMPDTEFTKISCTSNKHKYAGNKFYLKLENTANNSNIWYEGHAETNYLKTFGEESFEALSNEDESIISISIRCKNIRTINITIQPFPGFIINV